MGILEIISAIVLIVACVFIVLVVLMQDTKQGMSQTITGGSADNYYPVSYTHLTLPTILLV